MTTRPRVVIMTAHNVLTLIALAVLAVLISVELTVPPEEPEWVVHNKSKENNGSNDAVRFLGGDGSTLLTGFWHFPPPPPPPSPPSPPHENYDAQKTTTTRATKALPVIIMAPGLGLVQSSGLHEFVEEFRSAGFAVFTFDYATFGQSDGFPRHRVHPASHIADIQAAIAMIRQQQGDIRTNNHNNTDTGSNNNIDSNRIGLWGTSFGGGHVLQVVAAAERTSLSDSGIRAVVSQVPHTASGLESILGSVWNTPLESTVSIVYFVMAFFKHVLWTVVAGQTTYYLLAGPPGSAAFMQNPGDHKGYLRLLSLLDPAKDGWKNAATTDSGWHILWYRPLNVVASISSVPVLFVAAEYDTLCPMRYIQQAQKQIITGGGDGIQKEETKETAEILTIPNAGHFDVYRGKELQTVLASQVAFLQKHLFDDSTISSITTTTTATEEEVSNQSKDEL